MPVYFNSPTDMSTKAVPEQATPSVPAQKADPKNKKRNQEFRQGIDLCKNYRRKLVQNWSTSIDYRRNKPFASQSDSDQIAVPLDWSMTKTKQASLFSQVPQVRVNHHPESAQAGPWLAKFEARLNDTLVVAGIESAMDECLPDCINAAGFGAVIVSFESITVDKEVPAIDLSILPPELASKALQSGQIGGEKIPMEVVPEVVDRRYVVQRISPSDFLWPIEFTGSNFDNAPWLGRSGRVNWAEAVQRFKLKEEDKEKYVGEEKTPLDRLTHDIERELTIGDKKVSFDEIFYKEFQFDPEAQSYSTIRHLVFLNGEENPVVDEVWKGQQTDEETNQVIGSMKMPIRVLTLAYISDETIPPSDSAIGRPLVDEINKSRGQMIKQRERSLPVRWFDVNRVDPAIQHGLMRGTWQNMIPVQGEGSRIIGEVARATMPQEDFTFVQIAKSDLSEAQTIGPNQLGSGAGVETKGESQEIATNFQTRIGRERAKVAAFFVGIAEVVGGLMCLYEDPSQFGEGFAPAFSKALSFSILADSTVLVDANQRLERLNNFLNTYAKSGYVVLEPVLKEIAILTGLDPNTVIRAPEPAKPVEPNISLRLTGTEDMMNPLTLAFLLKSGQAPDPELIEQAKALIQQAVVRPPTDPSIAPPGQPVPPPNSPVPVPSPAPPGVGEANPDLTILPKIMKRSDDPASGGEV